MCVCVTADFCILENKYTSSTEFVDAESRCLLVDSRRLMYFLNNTQFSGASGPVQFAGADRTGIIRINQFTGNTSHVVGQFSANIHRNASDRMALLGSTIRWMTDDGLPPSDGTPGALHSQHILMIRCHVICDLCDAVWHFFGV